MTGENTAHYVQRLYLSVVLDYLRHRIWGCDYLLVRVARINHKKQLIELPDN